MFAKRFDVRALALIAVLTLAYLLNPWADRPPERPGLTHLLNVKATLAFDGEVMEIDRTILCSAQEKATLTSAWATQLLPFQTMISEPTKDGGLLAIRISWTWCLLGQDVWVPGVEPGKELKAPEEHLPRFLWVDAPYPKERMWGEYYFSETALENPGNRLKILSPFRFSVPEHPPSPEAFEAALEQRKTEKALWPDGFPELVVDLSVYVFPKEEWSDLHKLERWLEMAKDRARLGAFDNVDPERLVDFLNRLPEEPGLQQVYPSPETDNWMLAALTPLHFNIGKDRQFDMGIPRREVKDLGFILKVDPHLVHWGDRTIPVNCDADGNLFADFTRPGMLFLRREKCGGFINNWEPGKTLTIQGHTIDQKRPRPYYIFFNAITQDLIMMRA